LESKIINMVDRLKDKEDQRLESLFRSDPVVDDGFSVRVISRVRRQMWLRRLALPCAFIVGAAISAKPLTQLARTLPELFGAVPVSSLSMDRLPIESLPAMSTILMGVMLLGTLLMIGRMLEE